MDKVKELIIAHLELMKPEELILLYLLIRKMARR